MRILLLVVWLGTGALFAADNFRVVYDRTVITDTIVFQQPAANARGVQFKDDFTVYCAGECEVNVYRDGPAMTCATPATCELTPVTAETSAATPRFKVYYTASSLTGAVLIGTTKFLYGPMPFFMSNCKMTRSGTNVNYYVKLTSSSGLAIRMVVNTTLVQE